MLWIAKVRDEHNLEYCDNDYGGMNNVNDTSQNYNYKVKHQNIYRALRVALSKSKVPSVVSTPPDNKDWLRYPDNQTPKNSILIGLF